MADKLDAISTYMDIVNLIPQLQERILVVSPYLVNKKLEISYY